MESGVRPMTLLSGASVDDKKKSGTELLGGMMFWKVSRSKIRNTKKVEIYRETNADQ